MRKTVGIFIYKINGREYRHPMPHVHIEYQNIEISVSLIDFNILAGEMRKSRKAIDVLKNDSELVKELTDLFYELNPNIKKK